jgi:DNA-binding transcriptional MocR family regulator
MSNWTPILERLDGPLYLAIANQIKGAIERGELNPGTRLPTQRELATQLGISIHTVSQAYAEAERRGLVTGEIGRGTFVTAGLGEREPPFIIDRRSDDLIDLSINRPVCGQFHEERIRATLSEIVERGEISSMLVCRPIVGLDHHRLAGATWLRRRQIAAPAEQILITNGAAHGLLVAFATLTQPGDLVLTEALVDHGTIGFANVLHFRLKGLPLDGEGILPDAFEAACLEQEVKVLCTTPCLNNPTASVMGPERRAQIAAIARRHEVTIIENDVYGMLLPDAPPPIWTYLPERTYYVTSFTKIAVSGLRTGYLLAPGEAVPRLVRSLRTTSWMATPLVAELATRWIHDGTADDLVRWQREQLAMRHAVVDEVLMDCDYASRRSGLHVWLSLPEYWHAEGLVAEARLRNVAITPAQPFAVRREDAANAVRISIGAARTEIQLRQGLEFVADMLKREPEPFYMPV